MGVILFIIAYILFLPLTIFNALNVRKKGYFKETAINLDRFGNREFRFSLNKYLIIKDSVDKFTKFGNFCCILDTFRQRTL
jgi:hypothetical protein